jgi:hypothetical protein
VAKREKDKDISDEELERQLDVLWKNWESRRNCEKKHLPKFITEDKEPQK